MMAGGSETGIPRGRLVQQPYDSLDFVPTILELMDQKQDARKLPGRLIVELLNRPDRPAVTP